MTIQNITYGPGILPIHLGTARLQKTHHTLVHYFDLTTIYTAIENIDQHYRFLLNSSQVVKKYHLSEFENYIKLVQHTYHLIQDKLFNIYPHNSTIRAKRGLIDGLGSAIKFITGNMDANDASRINKIIKHLENNQNQLQQQILNQYSVNDNIIKQFNFTARNIQYNENLLKNKIIKLNEDINKSNAEIEILRGKDIFNQLFLTYHTILNLLTEIENSLTFCAIGTMHPSIIKAIDYFKELEKLLPFYKDQLPLPVSMENIIKYQSLTKVHCQQNKKRIHYFLTIPIEFNTPFDLYYIESLPTLIEDEYFTIIPNSKYLLKRENIVRPLSDICTMSGIYHCPSNLVVNVNTSCVLNILRDNSPTNCLYTKIQVQQDHIEPIPYINQYLGWFNSNSTLELECPNDKQVLKPHGIFILKTNGCKIVFNKEELPPLEPSVSVPLLIDFKMPQLKTNIQQSNMSILLKDLSMGKLHHYPISPIQVEQFSVYKPSVWTLILYVIIILAIVIVIRRKLWRIFAKKQQEDSKKEDTPPTEVVKPQRLPSDASF